MAIDFTPSWLDSDVAAFRAKVERFLDTEVLPADEAARARGHVGHEIWRRAGELGLLCADIPEQLGGGGGDFRHECALHESLARRGLTGFNAGVHSIAAHYLVNHGTEEQVRTWIPRLASGKTVGAIAMTEPHAGSDLQRMKLTARRDGEHYVLNGSKMFIGNGFLAGLVVVAAKTDPSQGAKGISLFVVETQGLEGYRVARVLDKIGLKAQDTSELVFEDVRIPAGCLLGEHEGRGFFQLMSDLPYERLIIASMAVAAMDGALNETLAWVKEREAFGQSIADFQNTRHRLAEVASQITVARSFVDRCIEQRMEGTLDTVTASIAKQWTTDVQGRVMDECLQLFGGHGFLNEHAIGRRYVDTRVQRIYGGTNEIMKEVIARALYSPEPRP